MVRLSSQIGSIEHPGVSARKCIRWLLWRSRGSFILGNRRVIRFTVRLRRTTWVRHIPKACLRHKTRARLSIWGRLRETAIGVVLCRLWSRSFGGSFRRSPRRTASGTTTCTIRGAAPAAVRAVGTVSPIIATIATIATIARVWIWSVWGWLGFFGKTDDATGKGSIQIISLVNPQGATNDALFSGSQVLQKSRCIWGICVVCASGTRVDVG